ncbi:MAG: hypothetical protein UHS52_08335 [Alistipes sp.]|nr:hypothetical protein [Alistipes sp.]
MKYVVRSLKYLVLLCVLYVALTYLMTFVEPTDATVWQQLLKHLNTRNGLYMVIAFVLLAALYPKFGYMRSMIQDCDIKEDRVRIDNAMRIFGFRVEQEGGDCVVYRAEGIVHRLSLMFEDRIEVRAVEGGVELKGLRRSVARVALQLRSYIDNRRFESDNRESEDEK